MAYVAALVVLAGVPIHLYWVLGGTWGLPGGAATAGLPGLHATNAVVSVLLAAGAALVFGLTRPWARRPPALVLLAPVWVGSVACISHGLYGMVTKGLYAAGAHSVVSYPEPLTAGQKNHAALLDLGVFEPWFLVQGLLLLFAGRWFACTAAGRRQYEQAARLLAASAEVRGLPDRSHPDVARIEQTARHRLGDARFAEAAREGTQTSWSQLVTVTLAS